MEGNPSEAVERVVADAEYDALREIANRLSGQLGQRQRSATDTDQKAAYQAERAELRSRLPEMTPGSEAVSDALAEWGARLRELET